jgi:hypothetical protein
LGFSSYLGLLDVNFLDASQSWNAIVPGAWGFGSSPSASAAFSTGFGTSFGLSFLDASHN